MNVEAQTAPKPSSERQWWLRTLAVFQTPRPVFAALRDPSPREAEAREEPILAIIILAGISLMLLAPETGRILDDTLVDNSKAVLAVSIFLSGAVSGTFAYWIGGALLYLGLRGAGSQGTYRRARHILAFAAVPTVLGAAARLACPAHRLRHRLVPNRRGRPRRRAAPVRPGRGRVHPLVGRAPRLRDLGGRALAGSARRRRRRAADPRHPRLHRRARDSAVEPLRNAASSSSGIAYVCSSVGNTPERTSPAKRSSASWISPPISA